MVTRSRDLVPYKSRDLTCVRRPRTSLTKSANWETVLRRKLRRKDSTTSLLLSQHGVIDWCIPTSRFVAGLTAEKERKWGQALVGYETNQWTTKLGESLLEESLRLLGEKPVRITKNRQQGENGKVLLPDYDSHSALYECKARTYTTTGTAGEKILGTPWKYSDCFRLYGKPLFIVCMAYQEQEAMDDFCIFDTSSSVRKEMLQFYEKSAGIRYIKFTDILKRLADIL